MSYAEYPTSVSPEVERVPDPACDRAFAFVPDRIRMYAMDKRNDRIYGVIPFISREQEYGITSYDIQMLRSLGIFV
jgi:hypothetical protein